ncbi:50S ribosomal protein L3, partial [Candidatus Amesbacteria bacterium RIFCSPLOWO2_02_FULL_48_11]
KSGMTGKYTPDGERVGATVLWVLPMKVADLRTKEKHGYEAVRFMIDDLRFKNKKSVREVRSDEKPEVGTEIKLEEVLKPGDIVAVTGTSKGKGFAGGVKRHGFAGGPRTHGQSDRERAPGSIGSTTTPGRVLKGKRMAGHMGNVRVNVTGLKVLDVDGEKRLVIIRGAVPGANKSTLLMVRKSE